ncbi:MAG TPA: DUF1858 domain-containing protein [Bryobacteraceae bacterium]|nr:DUF1858 domain-containing protein [Bryobacteraceae bacterium]
MKPEMITTESWLPDVITNYPAARAVFDRYGLQGCGGLAGPRETIGWFSRLHGVPLEQLLAELQAAASDPQPALLRTTPSIADTIYRSFFLAGIAVVFTLGCAWGAVNLFTIGSRHSFGGVNYSWILAHADAMVFGFVGFFVMGFAYQAFPRFKRSTLWRPKLAYSALPLMASGICLQTVGHLRAPEPWFWEFGLAGGLFVIAAASVFALVIAQMLRAAKQPEPYDRFIFASLAWFLIAAAANPIVFWLFESAPTQAEFLFRVSSFDIPYRDAELLGIAVVMILGVSLKFLPHAYGFREPSRRWRGFVFWGVNGAIAAAVATFIGAIAFHEIWLVIPNEVSTLLLLVVAAGSIRQYRLFGPVHASERDRGLKFIRAAYAWFAIAMGMLAFAPIYDIAVYQPLTGAESPFSHAYLGAYRHALTVGFILMMIVGVSSKVVPTLSGVDLRRANSLWPTMILLNAGNLLRITTQIATDYSSRSYSVMGVSGFIELAGLALWGWEMTRNIRFGQRLVTNPERVVPLPVAADWLPDAQTKVGELLGRYPELLPVFLHHGFTPLANPALRRTVARVVTIEQVCRRESVDLDAFLQELRSSIAAAKRPAVLRS